MILYGQSVGSGPTLDLAARLPQLRAAVLHSPILSGLRVMYPVKKTYWFDIYKVISSLFFDGSYSCRFMFSFIFVQNIDKITLVNCPVLVIHVSYISNSLSLSLSRHEGLGSSGYLV